MKNFGNATTHSFEVWLQLAGGGFGPGSGERGDHLLVRRQRHPPSDGPGLGNAGSGDPDSGQNWGAENRDGSSGVSIATAPANGCEYAVNTTPPTAGGTVTIPFDLSSKKAGTYRSVASMTSNVTPGTTQVVQVLTVTP